MKFSNTALAALCLSFGLLTTTANVLAQDSTPDQDAAIRAVMKAYPNIVIVSPTGRVSDCDWFLGDKGPLKGKIVIAAKDASPSLREAVIEELKARGLSQAQAQATTDTVLPPAGGAPGAAPAASGTVATVDLDRDSSKCLTPKTWNLQKHVCELLTGTTPVASAPVASAPARVDLGGSPVDMPRIGALSRELASTASTSSSAGGGGVSTELSATATPVAPAAAPVAAAASTPVAPAAAPVAAAASTPVAPAAAPVAAAASTPVAPAAAPVAAAASTPVAPASAPVAAAASTPAADPVPAPVAGTPAIGNLQVSAGSVQAESRAPGSAPAPVPAQVPAQVRAKTATLQDAPSGGWCPVDNGDRLIALSNKGTLIESVDGGHTITRAFGARDQMAGQVDIVGLQKSYQDSLARTQSAKLDADGESSFKKMDWIAVWFDDGKSGSKDLGLGSQHLSCDFLNYTYDKKLKSIDNEFDKKNTFSMKKGHPYRIVGRMGTYAVDVDKDWDKGAELATTDAGAVHKTMCGIGHFFQSFGHSGEMNHLREKMDGGDANDLAALLNAAIDVRLIEASDAKKYMKDTPNGPVPNFAGIWMDTKEAPRQWANQKKDTMCARQTGEYGHGHAAMERAIEIYYSLDRHDDASRAASARYAVAQAMAEAPAPEAAPQTTEQVLAAAKAASTANAPR